MVDRLDLRNPNDLFNFAYRPHIKLQQPKEDWESQKLEKALNALMASDFSYKGFHLMKRVPRYQQKMKAYLEAKSRSKEQHWKGISNVVCLKTE
ncbi:hypothetical protein KIN20_001686 [Parelaphostrongylus tenuis]|uniref:Uncharacterized protein n=1 Tax=Parelaphostrongylus tenuis TaxID=148309 RepID=A0AAD5MFM4_PARTN|nr:hypothetical protein KIN20_001686 [Parelaphostrongylus tenuis]